MSSIPTIPTRTAAAIFDIECTLPEADKVIAGTEKAKWEVKNVKSGVIEYDQTNGTFKITIDNNKGSVLLHTFGGGDFLCLFFSMAASAASGSSAGFTVSTGFWLFRRRAPV